MASFENVSPARFPTSTKLWQCCYCEKPNTIFFGRKRFRCKLCGHKQCANCDDLDENPEAIYLELRESLRGYRERDPIANEDDDERKTREETSRARQRSASPRAFRTMRESWRRAEDFGFDAVVDQLRTTTFHQDKSTMRSRNVGVPKGYVMSQEFVDGDADIVDRRVQAAQRDRQPGRGASLRSGIPRVFGFKPEDLIRAGIKEKMNVKPNNLTADIHPILQPNHWYSVPDDVYNTLTPGLRLASTLLTHPCAMQFYIDLLFGERVLDYAKTIENDSPQQRIPDTLENNKQHAKEAMDYIRQLGSMNLPEHGDLWSFTFDEHLDPDQDGSRCFGYYHNVKAQSDLVQTNREIVERHLANLPSGLQRSRIALHGDLYVEAKKITDTQSYPEDQKLRYYFFFATVLLHEIAHAIGSIDPFRTYRALGQISLQEPYFGHNDVAENGLTWESMTFGGRIDPINHDMSCKFGLATTAWPPTFRDSIHYAIPMDYIETIQQQETWDKLQTYEIAKIERALYVPRTGPQALKMANVTTLSLEEIQRVEREDEAEIIQRHNEGVQVIQHLFQETLKNLPGNLDPRQKESLDKKRDEISGKIMDIYRGPHQIPEAPQFKTPLDAGKYPAEKPLFVAPSPLEHFDRITKEIAEQYAMKHEAQRKEYERKVATGEISPSTSASSSEESAQPAG